MNKKRKESNADERVISSLLETLEKGDFSEEINAELIAKIYEIEKENQFNKDSSGTVSSLKQLVLKSIPSK